MAAQDPEPGLVPTYVRKSKFEVLPCVVKVDGIAVEDNRDRCTEGAFVFDRLSLDRMLTITQSEQDCRAGEARRLEEPDAGWSPLVVVLVGVGIVVLVGGAAFGVGYAVGAR